MSDRTRALPASLRPTPAGNAYTSAEVFAAEQAAIFERYWCCVLRADELTAPGVFRTVPVGRESVIVTRNRTGALRAFLNVCRHRGMRVCAEGAGTAGRALRCGYHAWTYDLDGRLVAAPNMASMPDVERARFGLHQVHVREWLGYVWLSLADEPPAFEATVMADVAERLGTVTNLDKYGLESLGVGRTVRYDVAANWKLIVENFMECYHCATIHPELTQVLPEFADGLAAQVFVNHGAAFGEGVSGFTVDGSPGVDRLPGIDDDQDRKYYAITIRPQVFVNLVPDHAIVHRMMPLAPDRTVVDCDWLFLPDVVGSGRDLDRSVELFHRVNQQDFRACELSQPAMASRAYRDGGVLVPAEHHIGAFHEWVRAALDA